MKHSVGLVGLAGRMGQLIYQSLKDHPFYQSHGGYDRCAPAEGFLYESLEALFKDHDYMVDFSSPSLTPALIQAALSCPKPIIVGTTGLEDSQALFKPLAQKVPVIIAPNTSLGAYVHRCLVHQLSTWLSEAYDIDILERHHRYKVDSPSGTTKALAHAIVEAKQGAQGLSYTWGLSGSPRPPHTIGVAAYRAGHLPGHHEVSFTNEDESLTITHTAFHRGGFVKGVVALMDWLRESQPREGFYSVEDVWGPL